MVAILLSNGLLFPVTSLLYYSENFKLLCWPRQRSFHDSGGAGSTLRTVMYFVPGTIVFDISPLLSCSARHHIITVASNKS